MCLTQAPMTHSVFLPMVVSAPKEHLCSGPRAAASAIDFAQRREKGLEENEIAPSLSKNVLFHSQKETCIKKNREQDSYVVVAKDEVNVRGGVVIN